MGCVRRSSRRASCWAAVASLWAVSALSGGCSGIFQERRPQQPATFQRVATAGELRVGAAEADITPDGSVYLAGFSMARESTGVEAPLKARALVLLFGDLKLAIVGIDNLGLMRNDVDWIKAGLPGFTNGCVFLCASHTHAAPDLVGLWGLYYLSSGRDPAYLTLVRTRIADAVRRAEAAARPADLVRGVASMPQHGLVGNSNRRTVFDRRVNVLHAVARDGGQPLGTLLHLACHPEVLRRQSTLVSPDFVGRFCDGWAAAGHGQAVFVNGALGAMVTPKPRGVEGLGEMGAKLVELAEAALRTARPVAVTDIEVRRRDVYMPLTSPGLLLGRLTGAIDRPAYSDNMRTGVGYLRIGDVEIACVPGEIEPTLAERLRRRSGRPELLVFGLVDDEVGYLMRAVDAHDREFAYERMMSPCVDAGEWVQGALTR